MMANKKSLFYSQLLAILAATLVWHFADSMLEFVFPTYLEEIGKSYFTIGLLISLASISGMLIDLPTGLLADRLNRKTMMLYGLLFSIITTAIIFIVRGNVLLALVFLAWGFSYQLWKVPRDAQFAAISNRQHRSEYYGYDNQILYLGQTLGPLAAGFVLLWAGFTGIVSVYIVLIFFSIAILYLYLHISELAQGITVNKLTNISKIFREYKSIKLFGIIGVSLLFFSLLFTVWSGMLWTLEPLFYGPDILNISPQLGGLLLAAFFLPGIFFSSYAGKVADRIGKGKVLYIGLFFTGLSIFLFSISHSLALIFAFALATAVANTFAMPALNGLLIDLSNKNKEGVLVGIWDLVMDLGYVIGPLIAGVFADSLGIRSSFTLIGIIFIITSVLSIKILFQNKTNVVLLDNQQ